MNKQYIDFQITHQRITRTDTFEVVGGSKGYLHARFSFCEDWADEKVRIAIFTGGGVSYPMFLENDTCEIPWEVLRLKRFYVGCVAGELLTSDAALVEVTPCGADLLDPSLEPTPTMFFAIMKKLSDAENVNIAEIEAAIKKHVDEYLKDADLDIDLANVPHIYFEGEEPEQPRDGDLRIRDIDDSDCEEDGDDGDDDPFIETDPTVPAWAKQPNKPTYTAKEVGAATMADVKTAIEDAFFAIAIAEEGEY